MPSAERFVPARGEGCCPPSASSSASWFWPRWPRARGSQSVAWFRGFDYRRLEYWGSDADIGWSLYTMETGWISGEILSVLALRQMKTSLWDLTATSTIPHHFEVWRERMLPDEVLSAK